MGAFAKKSWSPYLVGALIGLLSWVALLLADKPLGVSTTFVRVTSAIESRSLPLHAATNQYLQKHEPRVDWQMMLVIGIFVGAMVSAALSGNLEAETVPELWRRRFKGSTLIRWFWALIGGALLLFGARMAGGCVTGHGLSGGLQLAVSSWVVLGSMMLSGIATALLVFGRRKS